MVLLECDPFLSELHKMYERGQGKGAVTVTMKRSTLKPKPSKNTLRTKGPPPPPTPADCHCLVRASDGKRHVSTTTPTATLPKFASSLNIIMRAHMGALKAPAKKVKDKKAAAQPKEQQH